MMKILPEPQPSEKISELNKKPWKATEVAAVTVKHQLTQDNTSKDLSSHMQILDLLFPILMLFWDTAKHSKAYLKQWLQIALISRLMDNPWWAICQRWRF